MRKILITFLISGIAFGMISCGGSDSLSVSSSDDSTVTTGSLSGNGVFIVAGLSGNILKSTDKGSSFDNATSPTSKNLYEVEFGNSTFVVSGDNGTILKSTDNGSSFDSISTPTTNTLFGVGFGNNIFTAVGISGSIVKSTDNGVTWDNATSPTANYLRGIVFGNNTFIAVGDSGNIVISGDSDELISRDDLFETYIGKTDSNHD